jgi:hypothetical protein
MAGSETAGSPYAPSSHAKSPVHDIAFLWCFKYLRVASPLPFLVVPLTIYVRVPTRQLWYASSGSERRGERPLKPPEFHCRAL